VFYRFQNTENAGSAFTASVTMNIFEMDRKRLLVHVQCLTSKACLFTHAPTTSKQSGHYL
jgi:hypothetical protein